MIHSPEKLKRMELRAKTDRQLAALLNRTLARGVRMALEGAEADSPELSAGAQKAYSEARILLLLLRDAAVAERRGLERDFGRLRCLLDAGEFAGARVSAACP